eukprot:111363-Hanusia_phi.AAC.3
MKKEARAHMFNPHELMCSSNEGTPDAVAYLPCSQVGKSTHTITTWKRSFLVFHSLASVSPQQRSSHPTILPCWRLDPCFIRYPSTELAESRIESCSNQGRC